MKKINRGMSLFFLICSSACVAQHKEEGYLKFDIWKYIDSDYTGILSFTKEKKEINIPYYEFTMEDVKIGQMCLFAIPKASSEDWNLTSTENDCNKETDMESLRLCQFQYLVNNDTTLLKDKLELYLFVIEKSELQGPFVEEVEGGKINNYYPKKGSTFLIYTYVNNRWKSIDRYKQEGNNIPRSFGAKYMEELALEKIND
jgi:hypothetical protein